MTRLSGVHDEANLQGVCKPDGLRRRHECGAMMTAVRSHALVVGPTPKHSIQRGMPVMGLMDLHVRGKCLEFH